MTTFRTVNIDGLDVFVREAGDPASPALVLLHGYPSSSFMFRDLIPLLAPAFHVVAPDMIGFGHSAAPAADRFAYTFDNLAGVTSRVLDRLGVRERVLYMHDFGGPVGMRLALAAPDRVRGLVVQNANAYMDGVSQAVAGLFLPLWEARTPATIAAARAFMTAAATRLQYAAGARDPAALCPDTWTLDQALLDRPGVQDAMLALFVDYQTNVAAYDAWHAYLRQHQPPTLVAWGKNDPFFVAAGAEAFRRDLPAAQIELLDGGHFALEEHAPAIARHITRLFARLAPADPPRSMTMQAAPSPHAVPHAAATSDTFPTGRAIAVGGAAVGVLDAADGVAYFGVTAGQNPIQVLQYIASGALGPAAFSGGLPAAALGAALHFALAYGFTAAFMLAWRQLPALRAAWAPAGLAYGAAVWALMNLVVLPMSRVPQAPLTALSVAHGLAGHALFVGLAAALVARREAARAPSR
jgi:pimeloyl-ACP methyl ester carboxylesterase